MENLISNTYPEYINGEMTMAGVLRTCWNDLSKRWNSKTQRSYAVIYNNVILPYFSEKPLSYYDDPSYFDNTIEQIRTNGTRRSQRKGEKESQAYSESTLRQFRYLMRWAVKIASEHGICLDILWGAGYVKDEREEPLADERKNRAALWRSITPCMEIYIADLLLTDPYQIGYEMALLLMWVFGLRNKEACGVTFGDILPIPEHPDKYRLAIHMSTINETHNVKSGGKTKNMYRYLPIPKLVYDFLMERKSYIGSLIESGKVILPKLNGIESIEDLPIACDGKKYAIHCSSRQVTNAGRQLFKKIGMPEDLFCSMSQFTVENHNSEDEPTAYVFRRHYATTMKILGYTTEQMQYSMGHQIHSQKVKRSFFSNPDMMNEMYDKMSRRPLVNPKENWLIDNESVCPIKQEISPSICYHEYYKNEYQKWVQKHENR